MTVIKIPKVETDQQAAVVGLRLLDSAREERFDRIARLAAATLDMPAAVISLVEARRTWFKSEFGLRGLREVPRDGSFCSAALGSPAPGAFVVRDAARDRRFKEQPLCVKQGIRFYAGLPLLANGVMVGMLAVMDRRPRDFPEGAQRVLADLANFAEQELRGVTLREALDRLAASEQRAEEQHARFAAFMDHLPNVAFMKDAEGRLVYINRCHQQTFGIKPEDVLGRRDDQWLPREVYEKTMAADRLVIETGQASETAENIPTVEGIRNWLTFKFPIPTANGERLLGGVAVDITVQHEAEAAMRGSKEAAETANRAKSQFVANMSHEVRTPLNGILGVTAMLLEMELKTEQRQLGEIVLGSAQALLAIVNDILDFSKIEAGRIELEKIDFDLPRLVASIVELNSVRASQRCLTLTFELAPEVPPYLHGDPLRFRQVLNNLLGNATKFSDHGQVSVAGVVEWMGEREAMLRFTVTDAGIGIPLEKQANIFEPFTQADVSTTRQFGGTGLGLSICRQLVELMGGTIGVESKLGEGARFSFTARFGIAASAPREAFDLPAEAEAVSLPKLRVLLAEDSAINRLVATHQLQKFGCVIDVVEDGRQAVEAIETSRYDLVLMDCQMPVMDGYEATAEIRRREGTDRHTPIIALTANAMAGERERCLALGMDGYLSKPFRAADLRALLTQTASQPRPVAAAHDGPIDPATIESLREECDGSAELFAEYVRYFREDAAQARERLIAAAGERQAAELHRIAHRLRGGAANFGATTLVALCTQLEERVAEENVDAAAAFAPSIIAELDRVEAALAGELER